MSWAGLDANSVMRRDVDAVGKRVSRKAAVVGGAIGFGLASLAVFGSVALAERRLHQWLGTGGSYALWTALFMVLGGIALGRLVAGRGSLGRFVGVFSLGFALYGAGWCAGWFVWKWVWGEIVGTVLATGLLHLVMTSAFGGTRLFFTTLPVIVAANLAGYFGGEGVWFALKHSPVGMTLWGVVYGLCVGAGLGWVVHRLQQPLVGKVS